MVRNLFKELVLTTKFVDPNAPSPQQPTERTNDALEPVGSSPMGGTGDEKRNSEEASHLVEPTKHNSREISSKDSAKENGSTRLQSPQTDTKANDSQRQTGEQFNEVREQRNISSIEKVASQRALSSSQLYVSTDNNGPKHQSLSNNKTSSDLSPCSKLAKQWEQNKNIRRKKRALKSTINPTGVKIPTSSSSEETVKTPPPLMHSSPAESEVLIPTHATPREQEEHIQEISSSGSTIVPPAVQAEIMQSSRQEKKANKTKPLFISPFISPVSTDDEQGAARDDYRNAPSPASTEVSGDESFLEDYW
jgi:hypothetical protein